MYCPTHSDSRVVAYAILNIPMERQVNSYCKNYSNFKRVNQVYVCHSTRIFWKFIKSKNSRWVPCFFWICDFPFKWHFLCTMLHDRETVFQMEKHGNKVCLRHWLWDSICLVYLLKEGVENILSCGTCHQTRQGTNSAPAEINYNEKNPAWSLQHAIFIHTHHRQLTSALFSFRTSETALRKTS